MAHPVEQILTMYGAKNDIDSIKNLRLPLGDLKIVVACIQNHEVIEHLTKWENLHSSILGIPKQLSEFIHFMHVNKLDRYLPEASSVHLFKLNINKKNNLAFYEDLAESDNVLHFININYFSSNRNLEIIRLMEIKMYYFLEKIMLTGSLKFDLEKWNFFKTVAHMENAKPFKFLLDFAINHHEIYGMEFIKCCIYMISLRPYKLEECLMLSGYIDKLTEVIRKNKNYYQELIHTVNAIENYTLRDFNVFELYCIRIKHSLSVL